MTTEDTLYAERMAIEAIKPYAEARDAATDARKAQDAAGALLKGYMVGTGLAELCDYEHNLKAVLTSVSAGNERWDVRSMPAALIEKLAAAGCLTIDKKAIALDANTPLRMDAKPYYVPAGNSPRLHVEAIKE